MSGSSAEIAATTLSGGRSSGMETLKVLGTIAGALSFMSTRFTITMADTILWDVGELSNACTSMLYFAQSS